MESKNKRKNFPVIGAIVSAFIASLCCIGPVVLAIIGVSGAGLFSKFESLRPYLFGLTAVLLAVAFYLTYKKREVLCEDGSCKIKSAGKWNKITLWIATILIIGFIVFPYINFSGLNLKGNITAKNSTEITIPVKGMTCSGCNFNVEKAINKLEGIISAKADHTKGNVVVKLDSDKVTVDEIITRINETGYKAKKP